MSERYYCKTCKHSLAEAHLWEGKCPTCGQVPRQPTIMKPRKKVVYDLEVSYKDKVTGEPGKVIYRDVSAYNRHRIINEGTNVTKVITLDVKEV